MLNIFSSNLSKISIFPLYAHFLSYVRLDGRHSCNELMTARSWWEDNADFPILKTTLPNLIL